MFVSSRVRYDACEAAGDFSCKLAVKNGKVCCYIIVCRL